MPVTGKQFTGTGAPESYNKCVVRNASLCREIGVKMKALLRGIYELLFTELAIAEDGTLVRQTVVRPGRG